jgi:glycosyltransferase involved in cell wall biosynthesis
MSVSSRDLSIVVPLYNEEECVAALCEAVTAAMSGLDLYYELLLVDDGSRDSTFERARALAEQDDRIRVVKFRRNYGQTPAMAAGIDVARGRVIVTMDGDLQNDPADIPMMLEQIESGYDIVVGWRFNRQDKLITRRIPSRIANWLIGKVTGVPIRDNGCSLKAYRADVIKAVPLYSEMHRFIPAMASVTGARIAEVKVRHHARVFGQSKYGLSRIYKVLLDLLAIKTLIAFTTRPLLWFSLLSVPSLLVSLALLGYAVYEAAYLDVGFSIPLAGTGVLLGALTITVMLTGVLAELIYKTGDVGMQEFSFLTARGLTRPERLNDGTAKLKG